MLLSSPVIGFSIYTGDIYLHIHKNGIITFVDSRLQQKQPSRQRMQIANSTSTSISRAFYLHYNGYYHDCLSIQIPILLARECETGFINTILYLHYVHVETRIEGTVVDQEIQHFYCLKSDQDCRSPMSSAWFPPLWTLPPPSPIPPPKSGNPTSATVSNSVNSSATDGCWPKTASHWSQSKAKFGSNIDGVVEELGATVVRILVLVSVSKSAAAPVTNIWSL